MMVRVSGGDDRGKDFVRGNEPERPGTLKRGDVRRAGRRRTNLGEDRGKSGAGGLALVEVDHLDGATLFAVRPHRTLPVEAGSARHAKFRDLRAILTVHTKHART